MIWPFTEDLRIYKEEQLQMINKGYLLYLLLLKIKNMMDIKEVLLLRFIRFLMKKLLVVVLIMKLNKVNHWLKNYINKFFKKLKENRFILHLKKKFGLLI